MFYRKALQIAVLFLISCGQPMVDLNELETFFRGREVLFDNDYGNSCGYTLRKTENGLEVQNVMFPTYIQKYSFSDFEIVEKYALGQESKYFEIGQYRVIGQPNATYFLNGSSMCYQTFY